MKNFHHLTLENPTDFQRSFLGVVCASSRNHMGMGQKPGSPGEPQNSWDLWMFIPLKMLLIGIDPYPHVFVGPLRFENSSQDCKDLRFRRRHGFESP